MKAFSPPWWLANPHAQTLYAPIFRQVKGFSYRMERLELADGDFLDLAWGPTRDDGPLVILFHGLCGSCESPYARGWTHSLTEAGAQVVVVHFRGAGGIPNRKVQGYHLGVWQDVQAALEALARRFPKRLRLAVGVSLGANALLNYLAETSDPLLIEGAAAICAPFRPEICADRLNIGFSRLYREVLLFGMKADAKRKRPLLEGVVDLRSVLGARDFWALDEALTAPVHGFSSVRDYYAQTASGPKLAQITCPTLVVSAADDPFMTPEVLPDRGELPPAIQLEVYEGGGHVGFVYGTSPLSPRYWLDERLVAWLHEWLGKKRP